MLFTINNVVIGRHEESLHIFHQFINQILYEIIVSIEFEIESSKEWMLNSFSFAASKNKRNMN